MGRKVKRTRRQKQRRRQEGGAFRVHPLFLLAGAYACFNRSLPLYLGAVLVALEHECAHSLAAAKLGFCLNRGCRGAAVQFMHGVVFRGAVVVVSGYVRVYRYGVLSFAVYRRGQSVAVLSAGRRARFKMRAGDANGR